MKEKTNIKYGKEIEMSRVNSLLEQAGYHNPNERLKEHATIRIYEDKQMYVRLDEIERKIGIVIKMLAKLGYVLEGKR